MSTPRLLVPYTSTNHFQTNEVAGFKTDAVIPMDIDMLTDLPTNAPENDIDAEPPSTRIAWVEDLVEEEQHAGYSRSFSNAGGVYPGQHRTTFEKIRDDQILKGYEILGPFRDDDEWQFAKWIIKNVGHNAADELLRMPMISSCAKPSFHNKKEFLEAIDGLPGGVSWNLEEVTMTGSRIDNDGQPLTETLELWYRDPMECIAELMGNPMFCNVMKYAPEKLFLDLGQEIEVVNEMWTGSWWWDRQSEVPDGATISPIILSSDKTQLSQFRGDKSAWPVYLTIGNISKEVRREPSSYATVLLGYLPIGKFNCYADSERQFARYRLFHHCMGIIIQSIADAEMDGVPMTCADGLQQHVYPIIAAYVADYPEQCLVGCCMESRCPICTVDATERGSSSSYDWRTATGILQMINTRSTNIQAGKADSTEFQTRWKALGVRYIPQPFWSKLHRSDILHGFTPDLLHQLHKGVFKDHLVSWCMVVLGDSEIDARFSSMPEHPGLRRFKEGISKVKQWTGHEHKAMEKVFVGLMADAVADARVLRSVKAVVDFIFFSSLHTHTNKTLNALQNALQSFHNNKHVFIDLEARNPAHFNIPKIHAMQHYVDLIRMFGSADGFNTESPERLHIDYAKDAYRASNKKDYTIQMTRWLSRQEAVDRFSMYLRFCRDGSYRPSDSYGDGTDGERNDEEIDDLGAQPMDTHNVTQIIQSVAEPGHAVGRVRYPSSPPKALRQTPAEKLMVTQNASRFLHALQTFLQKHSCPIVPTALDRYDLYKQVSVRLPTIPYASKNDLVNIIRSAPPVPARGRRPAQPAHLDFALVRTGEVNPVTDRTVLQGTCYFVI
ncbi:hypothetical protein D9758_016819 [Tetrapyrgos nigripes]|uniref:Uncharacterized protein n=1 Tax=Tetrapyrgos nigripes TaxID=182062 RepID=A0A8H5F9Y3_9AGAR|nr:hypothetical protein D9758_016819 [Tetrapyrgos nigripes]